MNKILFQFEAILVNLNKSLQIFCICTIGGLIGIFWFTICWFTITLVLSSSELSIMPLEYIPIHCYFIKKFYQTKVPKSKTAILAEKISFNKNYFHFHFRTAHDPKK